MLKIEQFQSTALFERSIEIPQLPIHTSNDDPFRERLGNLSGNECRCGLPSGSNFDAIIVQRDVDLVSRLIGYKLIILRAELLE